MSPSGAAGGLRKRARKSIAGVYPSTARPAAPWSAGRAAPDYGVSASPDWRDVDWPPLIKRTEVEGNEIVYVDLGEGEGPPLVFVHGLAGKWQNWLENLPRAAQERRAVALDLPGFGESPMPRQEISISFYARLLEGFLDRLGIERAVVVGNSMGGFVSAELAIGHLERVDRLVLAAGAGISSTNLRRRPTMTGARVVGAISAAALARREAVVARPRLRWGTMSFVIRHPSRIRPDLLLEVAPGSNAPGFMDALGALLDYDFRDRVPEIRCPTLLVWGREDMLVPVADADEFERLIPDARKVVFDETGHVPMLERPQSFNDCLMGFVSAGRETEERQAEAGATSPDADGRPPERPSVLPEKAELPPETASA